MSRALCLFHLRVFRMAKSTVTGLAKGVTDGSVFKAAIAVAGDTVKAAASGDITKLNTASIAMNMAGKMTKAGMLPDVGLTPMLEAGGPAAMLTGGGGPAAMLGGPGGLATGTLSQMGGNGGVMTQGMPMPMPMPMSMPMPPPPSPPMMSFPPPMGPPMGSQYMPQPSSYGLPPVQMRQAQQFYQPGMVSSSQGGYYQNM